MKLASNTTAPSASFYLPYTVLFTPLLVFCSQVGAPFYSIKVNTFLQAVKSVANGTVHTLIPANNTIPCEAVYNPAEEGLIKGHMATQLIQ